MKRIIFVGAVAFGNIACSQQPARPMFTYENHITHVSTWDQAKAYCERLNREGHSDWRLPDSINMEVVPGIGIVKNQAGQLGIVSGFYAVDPPEIGWWLVERRGAALVLHSASPSATGTEGGNVQCVRTVQTADFEFR